VSVDAGIWSSYKSGVIDSSCGTVVNHLVLLVAVAADGTWKAKNSWGTTWGEAGYVRLAAGDTCAICKFASTYPVHL
jgi:cathepsin L